MLGLVLSGSIFTITHKKPFSLPRYVDTKVLTIKMEKGWKPGMKLKFKGEGNQLYPKSGPAGDIYFTIVEDEHPTFERILDSYDVLYIHKCNLVEAMTGHIINLNLLDGNW